MTYNGYTIKCEFSVAEAIGQIIIWLILSVITFGIGLFFMPYYVLKAPINKSSLIGPDGNTIGRLHVDVSFGEILGHAIIWILLAIVTLGLAIFVYYPSVIKRLLNGVVIQ